MANFSEIEKKDPLIKSTRLLKRVVSTNTAFIKRAFDIIASALGLLCLSPFFGIIAMAIKRDSPGPIFYRGERVGRRDKTFEMLKFRSMYETPESYNGPPITSNEDDRITPYGQWLRDTKLNELPQLWNVLKGEMSLVGPRPEYPDFVNQWPEDIRAKVLSVRPGITSPASILYHDEEKHLNGINFLENYLKEIMPDKLRLDLLYIDTHGFVSDLDIIFMTLLAILPRIGKKTIRERRIFSGPLYGLYTQHLTWLMVDFMVTFASVGIAGMLWRFTDVIDLGIWNSILLALIISLIFTIVSSFFGLHRIVWRYASASLVIDVSLSVLLTVIIVIIANRLFYTQLLLPPSFILNFSLLMVIGLIAVRYRERLVTGVANRWVNLRKDTKALGERVLIVGAGAGGEMAVWLMHKSEFAPAFTIMGFVDDDYRKQKAQMAGYPVLGTSQDIPSLVETKKIGLILFSISKIGQSDHNRILRICHETGVRVIVVPELLEILNHPTEDHQTKAQT